MKSRRKRRARSTPGSDNIVAAMQLWLANNESNGNSLFYAVHRSQPISSRQRFSTNGGGLAAWQINQSGYVQYGTIEK